MKPITVAMIVFLPTFVALAYQEKQRNDIPPVEWYGIERDKPIKQTKLNPKLPDQLECLALNAYHEARGEGVKGMEAVTQVVLNRTRHGKFPSDACSVVYQPSQFSWVGKATDIDDEQSYKLAKQVAKTAIKGKLPNHVGDAAFYVNLDKVNLKKHQWINGLQPVKKIGSHQFYREKQV